MGNYQYNPLIKYNFDLSENIEQEIVTPEGQVIDIITNSEIDNL